MIQPIGLTDVQPDGVLLVGHGTRDPAGTEEFFKLSERLATVLDGQTRPRPWLVRPCLLEFQKPDIAEAWSSLMQARCREIVVAPLLLFSAGHAKSDIPGEVEAARAAAGACDHVRVRYAKPITRQAAMIDAVRERLRETLHGNGFHGRTAEVIPGRTAEVIPGRTAEVMPGRTAEVMSGRTAVVMVGRGSRDPCATSDMRVLSEVAVRGRAMLGGVAAGSIAGDFDIARYGLFTTFYAMAEPRLPDTLEQVAGSGEFDRIVVHPHLLFSGRLYDAIVDQVSAVADEYPQIELSVSAYLGPTEAVATAIAARIRG